MLLKSLASSDLPCNTFRFDFRGNGQSGGETGYGNYEEEAEDLQAVVQYLDTRFRESHGPVIGVLGHSKGASVVLIFSRRFGRQWTDRYQSLYSPTFGFNIICLSGRCNMDQVPADRFSKEQLDALEQKGQVLL
jgi:hypothetical protein